MGKSYFLITNNIIDYKLQDFISYPFFWQVGFYVSEITELNAIEKGQRVEIEVALKKGVKSFNLYLRITRYERILQKSFVHQIMFI